MKTSHTSADRLVLTANRRMIALVCIAASPLVIWLGLMIVEDGDTEWFGWAFAGLGGVMALAALFALFARLSLTLDRTTDLVRFTIAGLGRRRNRTMPLSELADVELRRIVTNQHEHTILVFLPKPESAVPELPIREFWTRTSAEEAHFAIHNWLKDGETGSS